MLKILALDVESGGFSADRHALTQIAIVACTVEGPTATEVDRLVRYVVPAPGLLIEESALSVQGHTHASLRSRPGQVKENAIMEQIQQFCLNLGDGWVSAPFVAHNAGFDHAFLAELCRRTSTPLPARDAICTIERQKYMVKRDLAQRSSNKLSTLAGAMGLSQSAVHDAGEDALLCAALFAWQESLVGEDSSLLTEGKHEIVGRIYQHIPASADGWWTKGPPDGTGAQRTMPHGTGAQRTMPLAVDTQTATNGATFSFSKDLVELHRRARLGDLPALTGYTLRTGEIEDANRYVTGVFSIVKSFMEDLERINQGIKNIENTTPK